MRARPRHIPISVVQTRRAASLLMSAGSGYPLYLCLHVYFGLKFIFCSQRMSLLSLARPPFRAG